MQGNPYSVSKLAHHPDYLAAFREGRQAPPLFLNISPSDRCQQNCWFCSYRLENDDGTRTWKNSEFFDDSKELPWPLAEKLLDDAKDIGVKAIEVTGGGEPLLYKYRHQFFEKCFANGFDTALVTNGALMSREFAHVHGSRLIWARVSIDAGNEKTYAAMRRVPAAQWKYAWNAVRMLAENMQHKEKRLGVGFVVTNENYREIIECVRMAKEHGADNVRLSLRFGPEGNDYFVPGALDEAERQGAEAARLFNDEHFMVADLIGERRRNQLALVQDYEPCYTMKLLGYVGGNGELFTCCTLAFTPEGRIGDLKTHSLKELWFGDAGKKFWAGFKVGERCKCQCLFEKRNKAMIAMVDGKAGVATDVAPPHVNFV